MNKVKNGIDNKTAFTQKELDDFISLNQKYYYPWFIVGNYYFKKENYQLAYKSFMQVSAKSFNSTQPREKWELRKEKKKKKWNEKLFTKFN